MPLVAGSCRDPVDSNLQTCTVTTVSTGCKNQRVQTNLRVQAVPITAANVSDACAIRVAPEQEAFVAPVANSLAEAYVSTGAAWPRLIVDDERPVGFVMASFDPDNEISAFRCGVWRLNVDAAWQRRGVGRYAVEVVLAEAQRRGYPSATVLWIDKPGGPRGFHERLGFVPTGEVLFGETVGRIDLSR
jgi:diamine N-acetyltransferase